MSMPATGQFPFSLTLVSSQGGGVLLRCSVTAQSFMSARVDLAKLVAIPVEQVVRVNMP